MAKGLWTLSKCCWTIQPCKTTQPYKELAQNWSENWKYWHKNLLSEILRFVFCLSIVSWTDMKSWPHNWPFQQAEQTHQHTRMQRHYWPVEGGHWGAVWKVWSGLLTVGHVLSWQTDARKEQTVSPAEEKKQPDNTASNSEHILISS